MRDPTMSNRLLGALPPSDRLRIVASGRLVDLVSANVLYSPDEAMTAAYFPICGFISLTMPIDGHSGIEVGVVGSEGMFGVPIALGVERTPVQAVVRGTGSAIMLDASVFRRHLKNSEALRRAVGRYAAVQLGQLAQTAACTRFHHVEARLARWLLTTQDRARSQPVEVTHELLGSSLGVRRAGITVAAGSLQRRGLISYHRGTLTVLSRRRLKAAACGCYAADRAAYERLLG